MKFYVKSSLHRDLELQDKLDNHVHSTYVGYSWGAVLPVAPTEADRGKTFLLLGGQGVADELYVCAKKIDDTYAWLKFTAL